MLVWFYILLTFLSIYSECKNVLKAVHPSLTSAKALKHVNYFSNVQHRKPISHTPNFIRLVDDEDDDYSEDEEYPEEVDEPEDDEDEEEKSDNKNVPSLIDRAHTPKNTDLHSNSHDSTPRICGQGKRDILIYQQHDYGIALMGSIDRDMFKLYAGNIIVKDISIWDIISPIEVVNNKCFSVRQTTQLPTVLCAGGLDSRNSWMNALESARLCLVTKIKHYLPNSVDSDFVEPEDPPPSGINVFVEESQFGKPEIVINGKTLEQIKKAEVLNTLNNTDYETTGLINEYRGDSHSHDKIETNESKESLAEAELNRDNAPEFGHVRMF